MHIWTVSVFHVFFVAFHSIISNFLTVLLGPMIPDIVASIPFTWAAALLTSDLTVVALCRLNFVLRLWRYREYYVSLRAFLKLKSLVVQYVHMLM